MYVFWMSGMYRFVQSISPFCSANSALVLELNEGMRSSVTMGLPGCQYFGFLLKITSCGVNDFTTKGPVPTGFGSANCEASPVTEDQVCWGTINTCPPSNHTMG